MITAVDNCRWLVIGDDNEPWPKITCGLALLLRGHGITLMNCDNLRSQNPSSPADQSDSIGINAMSRPNPFKSPLLLEIFPVVFWLCSTTGSLKVRSPSFTFQPRSWPLGRAPSCRWNQCFRGAGKTCCRSQKCATEDKLWIWRYKRAICFLKASKVAASSKCPKMNGWPKVWTYEIDWDRRIMFKTSFDRCCFYGVGQMMRLHHRRLKRNPPPKQALDGWSWQWGFNSLANLPGNSPSLIINCCQQASTITNENCQPL